MQEEQEEEEEGWWYETNVYSPSLPMCEHFTPYEVTESYGMEYVLHVYTTSARSTEATTTVHCMIIEDTSSLADYSGLPLLRALGPCTSVWPAPRDGHELIYTTTPPSKRRPLFYIYFIHY